MKHKIRNLWQIYTNHFKSQNYDRKNFAAPHRNGLVFVMR